MNAITKPITAGQRVLVCGGRNYGATTAELQLLVKELSAIRPAVIIHGAARGADSLAANFARQTGIPCRAYPADWQRHGRRAGYLRNRLMLQKAKPDLVIAFPGGPGTAHMIRIAREANVPVHVAQP